MEQSNLTQKYQHCEIVDPVPELTHRVLEDTDFYCGGIQQGREPEGSLQRGDHVAVRSKDDQYRPWIITSEGVVAQIQSQIEPL